MPTTNPKNKPKLAKSRRALVRSQRIKTLLQQAPVSEPYLAPRPRFESKLPITPGASARYVGCDFVGTDSSSNSAAGTGALYGLSMNSTTFPRLAAIADVFLRFRYRRLKFHLIGKSASTQAGVGAWASFVLDAATSTITVNTEAIIKNAEGSLSLKGWESGQHEVDVDAAGPRWYNTDLDTVPFTAGSFAHFVPQTTAAGDLAWDIYVEYDVEFSEPVSGASVNLAREKRFRQESGEEAQKRDGGAREAIMRLQERLRLLEGTA